MEKEYFFNVRHEKKGMADYNGYVLRLHKDGI